MRMIKVIQYTQGRNFCFQTLENGKFSSFLLNGDTVHYWFRSSGSLSQTAELKKFKAPSEDQDLLCVVDNHKVTRRVWLDCGQVSNMMSKTIKCFMDYQQNSVLYWKPVKRFKNWCTMSIFVCSCVLVTAWCDVICNFWQWYHGIIFWNLANMQTKEM